MNSRTRKIIRGITIPVCMCVALFLGVIVSQGGTFQKSPLTPQIRMYLFGRSENKLLLKRIRNTVKRKPCI